MSCASEGLGYAIQPSARTVTPSKTVAAMRQLSGEERGVCFAGAAAKSNASALWMSPSSERISDRQRAHSAHPAACSRTSSRVVIGSAPTQPEDRGRFAQQAATTIPGVREARITMSEPLRIDGQPGYETRIDAISGKENTPVTIVQWLRFGSQTSMRIIGSSPRDNWAKAFPRFRAVRDGIQPRG